MENPLEAATTPRLNALGSAGPGVDTTEVVVIALVVGGIVLASIAASLIKSLGHSAIDKVAPADVPRVLGMLGTWIRLFVGFLPAVARRQTKIETHHSASASAPTVAAADEENGQRTTSDA